MHLILLVDGAWCQDVLCGCLTVAYCVFNSEGGWIMVPQCVVLVLKRQSELKVIKMCKVKAQLIALGRY